MIANKECYERGCACHDSRVDGDGIEVEAKREWAGLTDEEIDQGLLRTKYAMQTAGAWRDGVEWAIKQLQERNT